MSFNLHLHFKFSVDSNIFSTHDCSIKCACTELDIRRSWVKVKDVA